jgi:hypothetical protein
MNKLKSALAAVAMLCMSSGSPVKASQNCEAGSAYMEGGDCFQGPPCPVTCYFWGLICFRN